MVSLVFAFWILVFMFGLIGMFRGWAKELLVTFSCILALAINVALRTYVPGVKGLSSLDPTLFWFRFIILSVLVFFGYQTIGMTRFASKAAREKLQDSLLGFVLGILNGYLVIGMVWFYMAEADYPFKAITSHVGTASEATASYLLNLFAPHWLGIPGVYFALMAAFIFVLVVFI